MIGQSIVIYNNDRPHLRLGVKAPEKVHKKADSMVKSA
jgi:hypothetical protein